jgi:hypothetical protein
VTNAYPSLTDRPAHVPRCFISQPGRIEDIGEKGRLIPDCGSFAVSSTRKDTASFHPAVRSLPSFVRPGAGVWSH